MILSCNEMVMINKEKRDQKPLWKWKSTPL